MKKSPTESLNIYKLTAVAYGTTSASYLATRTMQRLAEDEKRSYPEVSLMVKTDFYMDDLVTGHKTIEQAKQLPNQLTALMKTGTFNLRKRNSNCRFLLNDLPASDRA